jgi:hypothetical protein
MKLMTGIFIAVNIVILLYGFHYFVATLGTVRGSEFGMLITLVHIFGLLFIWLATFSFWTVGKAISKNTKTKEKTGVTQEVTAEPGELPR